jgi:hypothetical protein
MMNKLTWALQILAALAFSAGGGMKLVTAPADLRADPAMGWATDFSDGAIRAIGAAEVAGGLGLIIPAATGIAPMLTPAAGVGLALLMGGAVYTHVQRNEPVVPPIVLGTLALAAGLLRAKRMRGSVGN